MFSVDQSTPSRITFKCVTARRHTQRGKYYDPVAVAAASVAAGGLTPCNFHVTARVEADGFWTVTRCHMLHDCDAAANMRAGPRLAAASTALVERLGLPQVLSEVKHGPILRSARAMAATHGLTVSRHVYQAIAGARQHQNNTDVDPSIDLGCVLYCMHAYVH